MPRVVNFSARITDDIGQVTILAGSGVVNERPVGLGLVVSPGEIPEGGSFQVTINASDPEGRPLAYALTASEGTVSTTADPRIFTVQL